MSYVFLGFLLFSLSVAVHIFYCRRADKSRLHAKAYLCVAAGCLAIYALCAWQMGNLLDPQTFWGLPFKFSVGCIFILLMPIYLCFYTLTGLMSPSKKILLSLHKHGKLSYDEILKYIEEEKFIDTRLDDLIGSGCVQDAQGRLRLSASGRKIAVSLQTMQMILGRDIGG